MPMAMFTFLEHYDWSGKRICPFCTNEGSGLGDSEGDLKRACWGATVEKGISIHGAEAAQSQSKKPYSQIGKEVVKCGYEKRKETQGVPERLDG